MMISFDPNPLEFLDNAVMTGTPGDRGIHGAGKGCRASQRRRPGSWKFTNDGDSASHTSSGLLGVDMWCYRKRSGVIASEAATRSCRELCNPAAAPIIPLQFLLMQRATGADRRITFTFSGATPLRYWSAWDPRMRGIVLAPMRRFATRCMPPPRLARSAAQFIEEIHDEGQVRRRLILLFRRQTHDGAFAVG